MLALDLDKLEDATQPSLAELAAAIREFRATGKKVIAYGAELTQERYYLAAQADEIYLDPMGFVLVQGYDRYRIYLKDALDKLGVDINVFRVGAFKSAVETYTRTSMSPEDREESRVYLTALWNTYQERGHARAQARPGRAVQVRRHLHAERAGGQGRCRQGRPGAEPGHRPQEQPRGREAPDAAGRRRR